MREPYDRTIHNRAEIVKLLEECLLSGERIELEINRKVRLFFTTLRDHFPEMALKLDATGQFKPVEPPYPPFSYLRKRRHLLFEPLTPPEGNAQIDGANHVLLRFFKDEHAHESEVRFVKFRSIRGNPALQLDFPQSLGVIKTRRHFRARTLPDTGFAVAVKGPEGQFKARIQDMSIGGLCFCSHLDERGLPLNEVVKIIISPPRGGGLALNAFVRSFSDPIEQQGCVANSLACGLQFDVVSRAVEMKINEFVMAIQREFLAAMKEKREGIDKAREQAAEEAKTWQGSWGQGEDDDFFGEEDDPELLGELDRLEREETQEQLFDRGAFIKNFLEEAKNEKAREALEADAAGKTASDEEQDAAAGSELARLMAKKLKDQKE